MGSMGGGWMQKGSQAGFTDFTTFLSAESQRRQQLARADALDQQAALIGKQNKLMQEQGAVEARNIDRRKISLRKKYDSIMGRNRVSAAVGNVDSTSGSTAEVSEGNIQQFADDIGENAYDLSLKLWETEQRRKAMQYQEDQYNAQSSYLEETSGNLLSSVLMGQIAGGFEMLGQLMGNQGWGQQMAERTSNTNQVNGTLSYYNNQK